MPAAALSDKATLAEDMASGVGAVPAPVASAPRQRRVAKLGARRTDVLLPVAVVLWLAGARAVDPAAMNDYGLLPALPVVYFVGLWLLVVSASLLLAREQLSPLRLGLHLVVLVIMLHGTVPLIFRQPNFPWVYKHIGVVNYIQLHGGLDTSVDIYQNWPGFFAIAAWFDRVAGVASPIAYAAWAPVYFNLLTCLELAFVFRWLPISRRVRWLALYLFVAGNWVGQDYFAPQAMAFTLSLAVFGLLLARFQSDRPPMLVRRIRRLASRLASPRFETPPEPGGEGPSSAPPRAVTMGVLLAIFAVVVATHPLSPYVVILGAGVLTAAGMVRPRWLVAALVALAVGYLFVRLPYIRRTQDLFASLGDPLHNVDSSQPSAGVPMKGRRLTALAAPALIAGLCGLGMIGILQRLRTRRTVLLIALLAASPALIALGQSYGGEAIFRIYLFSLPWIAVLAASAIDPGSRPRPLWSATKIAIVLSVTVALFMSAFFGAEELYLVRAGEVEASHYFYDHAEPDSVFFTVTALMFPIRVSAHYDRFQAMGDNPPNLLTTVDQFRHRMLGPDDLPAISAFVDNHVIGGAPGRYLILSTGQDVYARVLGLLPAGSMASLDRALSESDDWSVDFRNSDAVIFRSLTGESAVDGAAESTASSAAVPAGQGDQWRADSPDTSLSRAEVGMGLLGISLLPVAWRHRRSIQADHTNRAPDEEEMMSAFSASNGLDAKEVAGIEPPHASSPVQAHRKASEGARAADIGPPLDRPSETVLVGEEADVGEAIAKLRRLLRDDFSPRVRVAAVRALAGAPRADQLWALSVAMSDPAPEIRRSAIETLPVCGTTHGTGSVLAGMEDDDEHVRHAAYVRLASAPPVVLWMAIQRCPRLDDLCAVLRQHAAPHAVTTLVLERASSPEADNRILALQVASRLDTPGWVDKGIDALRDPDATVRCAAASGLRGHDEAVHALADGLQNDPALAVRTAAASALAGVDADVALIALIAALEDPHVEVRRISIDALVSSRSRGLAHRVADVLSTSNSPSAGSVLLGMGDVGEDALISAAVQGPSDRASAAAALLRSTGKARTLVPLLGAIDPMARLRVVDALGALGGTDALEGLVTALSDSWPKIRSRAAFHLGQIGDEHWREPLRRLSDGDMSEVVVRAAADALLLIDQRGRQSDRAAHGD